MLQRLAKAFAQVQAGNKFKNLINETPRIIYSLYEGKLLRKYMTI